MAPEVFRHSYDEKVDIWSCGIILYILLCGYPPFHGATKEETIKKIQHSPLRFENLDWMSTTEEAKDLIIKMLEKDPAKRIDAQSALKHSWFKMVATPKISKERVKNVFNRLKQYEQTVKLQNAIWVFITNFFLTRKEADQMFAEFRALDKDKDGQISAKELKDGYKRVFGRALPMHEVEKIMEKIDINKSGHIDYSGNE